MEDVKLYETRLKKKVASLKGLAGELAVEYVINEVNYYTSYNCNTYGLEKRIKESGAKTIAELFDLGLFDFAAAIGGKEAAVELQLMCEAISQQQFQYSYQRRSYHSNHPVQHHAGSIAKLLYKMELNKQQDVIEIGKNLTSYEATSYYYTGVYLDKKTNEPKMTIPYFEAKLALELSKDNPAALELVEECLFGENNTTNLSRSIIVAIVKSGNEASLTALGKLLLAAQRQEGIRQMILETADVGSVETLLFFIQLIRENDLIRFSAVQRAIGTWTGLGYEVDDKKVVAKMLDLAYEVLVNEELIHDYIASEDIIVSYAGLWAVAVRDYEEVLPYIKGLLSQKKHQQLAALYFLMGLSMSEVQFKLVEKLIMTTDDLDVLTFAMVHVLMNRQPYFSHWSRDNTKEQMETFISENKYVLAITPAFYQRLADMVQLIKGTEHTVSGKPFPWIAVSLSKESIYKRMILIAKSQENQSWLEALLNNGQQLAPENRKSLLYLTCQPPTTSRSREFLFEALRDRSSSNRELALTNIKELKLDANELGLVEEMLALKSGAIRQSVLTILQQATDEELAGTLVNLLSAKKQEKRLGGLDLMMRLQKDQRLAAEKVPELLVLIKTPTAKEQKLMESFKAEEVLRYHRENGFGLYQSDYQTPNVPALAQDVKGSLKSFFDFDATKLIAKLQSLSDLIHEQRELEYETTNWSNEKQSRILGAEMIGVLFEKHEAEKEQSSIHNYPLSEVWLKWMKEAKVTVLDVVYLDFCIKNTYRKYSWQGSLKPKTIKTLKAFFDLAKMDEINFAVVELPYNNSVIQIIHLLKLELTNQEAQLKSKSPLKKIIGKTDSLSLFELFYQMNCELLVEIPLKRWIEEDPFKEREYYYGERYADLASVDFVAMLPQLLAKQVTTNEEFAKLIGIRQEYTRRRVAGYQKEKKDASVGFWGMELGDFGWAIESEILPIDALYKELFLPKHGYGSLFSNLMNARQRKVATKNYPFLMDIHDTIIERILEIELKRGDSSTEVSYLAVDMDEFTGIEHFSDIVAGLEGEKLVRGYSWGQSYTKREVFSKLLKKVQPADNDTVEGLKVNLNRYKISDQQLIEAMLYAPQWIELVSDYLGWKGLKSTAWYFTAHSSDYKSQFENDQINRYSEITDSDFQEGAFDVRWFKEAYKEIGKKRFELIYDSAKYTSEGSKHRRSQLYADASLGKLKLKPLLAEVEDKRNKDKLRSLGLIPLNKRNPAKDAWQRYNYLQQFLKESKKFGAQRRASEGKAYQIALENLARNAGDGDVTRFSWRMEIFDLQELQNYFVSKEVEDTLVHLAINEQGSAEIVVEKAGKTLKAVPAKLKKQPYIMELQATRKKLKEQYRRSRKALEQAMERGVEFEAGELMALLKHPVIQPMLDKLVLIGGEANHYLGFLSSEGIRNVERELIELPAETKLRFAHPYDLYQSGKWRQIQHILFAEEIVQPFKQVFRELYVPNADEKATKESKRYAGHQIQPQKTVALLKNRDWVVSHEDGLRKVYYEDDIVATLYAMADWFSPADIEAPTIEGVFFYHRKTGKRLLIEEVPPLIFSEVMRDMDLVVSVAHVGGVDPETSFSTIETRAVLVEELAQLLKLENIKVKRQHVLIQGQLAEYSLHLGSGVVHQVGGRMIPILAVQSQHRGRLFLPFVDEDPRTAEIMSKLLLLSEDQKIKDPMILAEIQSS